MNIKQFMLLVKEKFVADNERLANECAGMWCEGLCLAVERANFDQSINQQASPFYSEAYSLIGGYRPKTEKAYWWWPRWKLEATKEQAINPRLAVLDAIIASLPD